MGDSRIIKQNFKITSTTDYPKTETIAQTGAWLKGQFNILNLKIPNFQLKNNELVSRSSKTML